MSDSHTPTTAGLRGPMSNFPSRCAAPARSCASEARSWLSQPAGTTSPSRRESMPSVGQRLFRVRRRRGDMGRCPRRYGGERTTAVRHGRTTGRRSVDRLRTPSRLFVSKLRLGLVTTGKRSRTHQIRRIRRRAPNSTGDSTSANVESPRSTGPTLNRSSAQI